MIRAPGSTALVALALLAGGCASPPPPAPVAAEGAPAAVQVEVDAPGKLKALLAEHLDIARVSTLSSGDALDATEWARLIQAAPAQARELVETEGYFNAKAKVTRDTSADGRTDTVRVQLEPGPRAEVQRVDVEFQGELERAAFAGDAQAKATLESLRDGWALPVGAAFRNPRWTDAKADLLARLRAAGYAAASWSGTAANVDTETGRVRLFVVADSGPLFLSGDIQVEGLVRHDADTVRNLADFAPGTPVTETRLLDFQDRLRQSGLFDGISVGFDPDPLLASAVPIKVRLKESARQIWTVGLGISADTGPRASLEHIDRRPFGWAAMARNKFEWGGLRQAWDGEISTHPLERRYRNLIGGAFERLESDTDVVQSQRLRVGRARDSARVDRLMFVEIEHSSRTVLEPTSLTAETSSDALSVNYHGVWRRIDSVLLPTKGYTLALQGGLGVASGTPGERGAFSRVYGRLTAYRPIGENWYGQARIELGQVFRPDSVPVPDSQEFRAGGDDSVRGYGYRTLGPVTDGAVGSGDSLFTASVELARPIFDDLPDLWGAVFIDAGRAAASFSDLKPAYGIGVGVRYRSPVGPLRLDLAYGEEVKKLRLHFSVGVAF